MTAMNIERIDFSKREQSQGRNQPGFDKKGEPLLVIFRDRAMPKDYCVLSAVSYAKPGTDLNIMGCSDLHNIAHYV